MSAASEPEFTDREPHFIADQAKVMTTGGKPKGSRPVWESRYRALEEAAVALREERDQLRADITYLRDYFKSTWNIDKIIERGRAKRG